MKDPVRIKSVSPLFEDDKSVHIVWDDGSKASVKLADVIARHKGMHALSDRVVFESVHVADWAWAIEWQGDIDMGTERLYELAQNQQQGFRATLHEWRKRHSFSYDKAALALGISRRSIGLYENGKQPVPKHIALACKGWEVEHH